MRMILTLLLGTGLALIFATPAAATAGDGFNQSLEATWTWGDCTVRVGVVPDSQSPWAAIAGTSVVCSKRHASTTLSVQLYYKTTTTASAWVSPAAKTTFVNSFGTGGRILKTGRYCGAGYWAERAVITISGLGSYSFPTYYSFAATGC